MRYWPLLGYIKNKIDKNKNFILIINGSTGSGKTYLGLRVAEDLAKMMETPFSVKDNVDFNFKKLLGKMKLEHNTQSGTVFVFEEVGAVGGGASSTQWQSKANAFFGSFLQTSRVKNRILIMTCPTFKDLDVKARRLCHARIEMVNINHANKTSIAKAHIIQVNRKTGDDYHKKLRFVHDGLMRSFSLMECNLPSKETVREYEKMKDIYVNELEELIMKDDDEKKKKGKNDCSHDWRFRMTTNDKICKRCGHIEPKTLEKPFFEGRERKKAIF